MIRLTLLDNTKKELELILHLFSFQMPIKQVIKI